MRPQRFEQRGEKTPAHRAAGPAGARPGGPDRASSRCWDGSALASMEQLSGLLDGRAPGAYFVEPRGLAGPGLPAGRSLHSRGAWPPDAAWSWPCAWPRRASSRGWSPARLNKASLQEAGFNFPRPHGISGPGPGPGSRRRDHAPVRPHAGKGRAGAAREPGDHAHPPLCEVPRLVTRERILAGDQAHGGVRGAPWGSWDRGMAPSGSAG